MGKFRSLYVPDAGFVRRVSVAERCFPIVDKSGAISTIARRASPAG
jgi:hypothetical protein